MAHYGSTDDCQPRTIINDTLTPDESAWVFKNKSPPEARRSITKVVCGTLSEDDHDLDRLSVSTKPSVR